MNNILDIIEIPQKYCKIQKVVHHNNYEFCISCNTLIHFVHFAKSCYANKLFICKNCLPECHIENCFNKSIEFCIICKRPLCKIHMRTHANLFDFYCHQKNSLNCVRHAKNNKN